MAGAGLLDKAKAIPALMQVAFLIQAIVSGAKEARPARTDRAPLRAPVCRRAGRPTQRAAGAAVAWLRTGMAMAASSWPRLRLPV